MLHPASVAVNLVPRMWSVVRSMWPLGLAILYGRTGGAAHGVAQNIDMVLIFGFFAMTMGSTIVHFLTLRYRFVDGRLEIRTGLLNRQTRVIAAPRVQNTEMVRNVFHRLSGLVELRIETASGTEVEGMLSALSVAEAKRLVEALQAARRDGDVAEEDPAAWPVVIDNGLTDLVWFGGTGTRLGAVAVFFGLAIEGITMRTTTLDPTELEGFGAAFQGVGALAFVVMALSGGWLLGVSTAVLRHYGFTLRERTGALVAEEGLFTKRRVELSLSKVQLVTVFEPLLRRLAGFGSVQIETAAAREGGDGTQRSEAVVPVVDADGLYQVVDRAVHLGPLELGTATLHPPDPKALLRAMAAGSGRSAVLAGVLTWWLWPGGLLAWILVPIAMWLAHLDHRHQGWLVTDDVVVSRKGYLSRRTWVVARSKLQSTQVSQGPILARYGLGQLRVRVAGSSVAMPVLKMSDALELQRLLLTEPQPVEDDLPTLDTDAIELL